MDLLIVILTSIAVICFWFYSCLKKRKDYFKDHGVPYVLPSTFLGFMFDPIIKRKHFNTMFKFFDNVNKDATYIGSFDVFYKPILIIRDLNLIKDITIKHFDCFSDKLSMFDAEGDPLIGDNVSAMNGKRWHEARTLLTPAFTSNKIKSMYEQMVKCADNLTNYLIEYIKDPNQAIDTKDLIRRYTADVIATCVYGMHLDSFKDPNNTFYVLGSKVATLKGIRTILKFIAIKFLPRLAKLFGIKFVPDQIENFFKDIVRKTVEMRDEKGIRRQDILQLMMDARGKTSDNLKLDITQMTAETFVFFFGGFETTATQICILAHELAIHPDIQEKLQAEIDDVIKNTNGKPTYEAINGMAYLNAVMNESSRKHITIGMLERLCKKPYELPSALPNCNPFTIQPETYIVIPITELHYDEKYYDKPDEFNPERYLQKSSNNQLPNLTFGMGPRNCIGSRFAILSTKILIFYLLSKYSLKQHPKTCNPIEYSTSDFTLTPKGEYWLSIESRSVDKTLNLN